MTKTKFPESWDLFSKTAQNEWLELQDDDFYDNFDEPLKKLNYEVNTPQKEVGKPKTIFAPFKFNETQNPKNLAHSLPKITAESGLSTVQKIMRLAYEHDNIANFGEDSSDLTTSQVLDKKRKRKYKIK